MGQRAAPRVPGPTCGFILSLGMLWSLGCGQESSAVVDRELTGVVTDLRTSEPLEGAQVTFTSDTLVRAEATTGGDGRYEIQVSTDTPFGQVRAQQAGYQPAEATVFFDSPTRRVDLELRPEAM